MSLPRPPRPRRLLKALVAIAITAFGVLAPMLVPALGTAASGACKVGDPNCPPYPPDPCIHTHSCPATSDTAAFSWQLKQLGETSDGAVAEDNVDHVNETASSPVSLSGCSSTAADRIQDYLWTFSNVTPSITSTTCATTWQRPLSHNYAAVNVTLTVVPTSGASFSVTHTIRYRDVVIASLGDSAASGEGAPENIGRTPAFRVSKDCDRSGWAASAQAALHVQQTLGADTTVHFWHLACSGATITSNDSGPWTKDPHNAGGILDPYNGVRHNVALEPQLQRLEELRAQTGNLPIDRLLLMAGANDAHWADVLAACLPLGIFGSLQQTNCVNGYTAKIGAALNTLPAHFARLNAALTAAIVPHDNIYLTQYFDPLNSLSAQPTTCPGEPLAWPNLRKWGVRQVEDKLQDTIQAEATNPQIGINWHFIDGIRQAFQGHGVCQPKADQWVNSWEESIPSQGDTNGTWHANRTGQLAMANIIYRDISAGLDQKPSTADDLNGDGYADVFLINHNGAGVNAYVAKGSPTGLSGFSPLNGLWTGAFDPATTEMAGS